MRIGIISDTHGLLRREAIEQLTGADHIIHAGDIGAAEVIDGLRKIARTTAVKGNVDRGEWGKEHPETEFVVHAGRAFYVVHNLKEITLDPAASGFDAGISGHSHRPKIETKNGIVCVNPGSAGPHRFKLPVAVATLAIAGSVILPRILEIAPYRKKSRVSHEEIATFNVNRVNRRLPVLLRWLGEAQPDIVCLQELKAAHEKDRPG
jgi:putative phosphoesterase